MALGSFVQKDEFEVLRTTIQNTNFMGRSFQKMEMYADCIIENYLGLQAVKN